MSDFEYYDREPKKKWQGFFDFCHYDCGYSCSGSSCCSIHSSVF